MESPLSAGKRREEGEEKSRWELAWTKEENKQEDTGWRNGGEREGRQE